jgi:hypothetical protein
VILIVTGHRAYWPGLLMHRALSPFKDLDVELIEGGQNGVDATARVLWRSYGKRLRTFPADWQQHGLAAGPIRNLKMIRYALDHGPLGCLAFPAPGSRGTWQCARAAEKAGILTEVIPFDADPETFTLSGPWPWDALRACRGGVDPLPPQPGAAPGLGL